MNIKILLTIAMMAGLVDAVSADAGVKAYHNGNYTAAFDIWKRQAEGGDARSQHNLGLLYIKGRGVLKDQKKAKEWVEKAAFQGIADSQHLMLLLSIEKPDWQYEKWGEAKFWAEKLYKNENSKYKKEAEELWEKHNLSMYFVPNHLLRKEEESKGFFESLFN